MESTKPIKSYQFWNQTDVGRVREINEDYLGYFETPNGDLFLICDGMGGHQAGEVASRIAVEVLSNYFLKEYYEDVSSALTHALLLANQEILNYAEQNPNATGLGTTAVVVLIRDSELSIAHIGDSRLYVYRKGNLIPLTEDHSWVQEMVKSGALSPEEAWSHPRKNQITQALGLPNIEPTIRTEPFIPEPDDLFLLCSDGLSGMITDKEITQILQSQTSIQSKGQTLVQAALQAGGEDNITIQIIHFYPEEVFQKITQEESKERSQTLLYAIIGLLGFILVIYWLNKTQTPSKSSTSSVIHSDTTKSEPFDSAKSKDSTDKHSKPINSKQ